MTEQGHEGKTDPTPELDPDGGALVGVHSFSAGIGCGGDVHFPYSA